MIREGKYYLCASGTDENTWKITCFHELCCRKFSEWGHWLVNLRLWDLLLEVDIIFLPNLQNNHLTAFTVVHSVGS